jgi:hypothetical protein
MLARALFFAFFCLVACSTAGPGRRPSEAPRGLRVFVAGHSFHVGIADTLPSVVATDPELPVPTVEKFFLPNSQPIQLWNAAENPAKEALVAARVDVLTLSPHILLPEEGVGNFVDLGLLHNPAMRFTAQISWLPFDDPSATPPAPGVHHDRNAMTEEQLLALHAHYFQALREEITGINKKYGRDVIRTVPTGPAVIRMRSLVRLGKVPGIRTTDDLFRDVMNHPGTALTVLNGYLHYAVIYRKSPVGLPVPDSLLHAVWFVHLASLNRLLQEVAWDAVIHDPTSGVSGLP